MILHPSASKQDQNFPVCADAGHVPEHQDGPTVRTWLDVFAPARRSQIANWFHFAVRSGCPTPEAVFAHVTQELHHRLRYALRDPERITYMQAVLSCLTTDRAGALTYAQHVLEYEALPPAARTRLKAQKSQPYQQQAMAVQPPTVKQLAFLQALGYHGPVPENRLAASEAIEHLLQQREGTR
jgi:hypothetical protein